MAVGIADFLTIFHVANLRLPRVKKKEKRSDIKSARGEVVEPNARGLKKLKIKVKSSLRNKNVRQGSRRLHDDDNIHWGRVFFF